MPECHWHICRAEGLLGEQLASLGEYAEAEPMLLRSQAGLRRARGEYAADTKRADERLAELYEAWNKPEQTRRQ